MFLIILLFLLTGCNENKNQLNDIYEAHEQPILQDVEKYTYGLYDGLTFEHERTFHIKDDSFKRDVAISNKTKNDTTFLLLVFNHGHQMDFKVSGNITNKYQFDIKSGETKNIEVTLQDLNDGFHSITYVILINPNELSNDENSSINLTELFSIRINIFKNVEEIPNTRPKLFTESKTHDEGKIHGVLLGEEGNIYKILFKENVNENGFSHNLVYGNSSSELFDFYLVALLNYEQISLGDQKYIYDELKPNEEKVLHLEFKEHLNQKVNAYQILMLPTPFEEVTKEEPFLEHNVIMSNKVKIIKDY